jgi:hypothetical protein
MFNSARPTPSDDPFAHFYEAACALLFRLGRTSAEEAKAVALALGALQSVSAKALPDPRLRVAANWLAAKAYYYNGDAQGCLEMASASLEHARGLSPIFVGYAYEVLSRAEELAGNRSRSAHFRQLAVACADDADDRDAAQGLLRELATV